MLTKFASGKIKFKDQIENYHLSNLQVYHYNDQIVPCMKQSNFPVHALEHTDCNIQNQPFQLQY